MQCRFNSTIIVVVIFTVLAEHFVDCVSYGMVVWCEVQIIYVWSS